MVERRVRDLLRSLLPGELAVTSGQLIDASGKRSRQADTIIYDQDICPTFHSHEDIRLLPVEAVRGVVEIKTKLTNLDEVWDRMLEFKSLARTAVKYKNPPQTRPRGSLDVPVAYHVIAFESPKREHMAEWLVGKMSAWTPHQRADSWGIDGIFSASEGAILHAADFNGKPVLSASPMQGTYVAWDGTQNAFSTFTGALIAAMMDRRLEGEFDLAPYLLPVTSFSYFEEERQRTNEALRLDVERWQQEQAQS